MIVGCLVRQLLGRVWSPLRAAALLYVTMFAYPSNLIAQACPYKGPGPKGAGLGTLGRHTIGHNPKLLGAPPLVLQVIGVWPQ